MIQSISDSFLWFGPPPTSTAYACRSSSLSPNGSHSVDVTLTLCRAEPSRAANRERPYGCGFRVDRRGARVTTKPSDSEAPDQVRPARRDQIRTWLRRALFAGATGLVSWAWSEPGFWSRFRAGDALGGWLLAILMYAVVAHVVIAVVRRYPVTGLSAVVLVGCLYGWLVEGMVAGTVYTELPFSLVWTAVAWHALLTVAVGWVWLPGVLRGGGWQAVAWCSVIGLGWGVWSASWWAVPPDPGESLARFSPASYLVFVCLVTALAALGYGLAALSGPRPDELRTQREGWVSAALLVLWAIPVVFVAAPWAPLVLVPLVGGAVLAIRRSRASARPAPGRWSLGGSTWSPGVPWRRLHALAAIPAAAALTYNALGPLEPSASGEGSLYVAFLAQIIGLCLVGTSLLAASLWGVGRARRP